MWKPNLKGLTDSVKKAGSKVAGAGKGLGAKAKGSMSKATDKVKGLKKLNPFKKNKFRRLVMWKWLEKVIIGSFEKPLRLTKEYKRPKRARTKLGRYKADDKSTVDYNEAWVGGRKPKKKRKVYTIKGKKYVLKKKS